MAHFQLISIASAVTSSRVTSGWKRTPPLVGPSTVLWWTRYPMNTSVRPSSIWVGIETTSARRG